MSAVPRYATVPDEGADSWVSEISAAADALKTPLMPWQLLGARLLGELRPDGLPRYKTVVISVPRQQGKTVLSRASVTARSQRGNLLNIYGTAQTRQYAARHVVALGEAIGPTVKLLRGVGAESVTWPNGSTYEPISPTEGGGHGDSIDFMLADEGWTLTSALMGGIRPAMIARPESQLLIISTMGTIESTVWNGIVARGREAVNDPDATMAYVEYSAEADEDTFDESKWHTWMPALGITVSYEDIRSAIEDMEPSEAVRAFGNRTTTVLNVIFPSEWVEAAWRIIEPADRMVLAVDVNEAPDGASVTSGYETEDGGVAVRLIDWRQGSPRWVIGTVAAIIEKRQVEAISVDGGGPARQIFAELSALCERHSVALINRSPRDLAGDTGFVFDSLRAGTMFMEKSPPLSDAFAGAHRKPLGDLWLVNRRRMTVDASPLISAILAAGAAHELAVSPKVSPRVRFM